MANIPAWARCALLAALTIPLLIACTDDDTNVTATTQLPSPSATTATNPTQTSNAASPAATDSDVPQPSASEEVELELRLVPLAAGFDGPTGIVNAGDGSRRLFILEQAGTIRVVQGEAVLATPFLDLSDQVGTQHNEQGLLGLAFHPDYASNGIFFVHYSDLDGNTVISRFTVSDDPNVADADSEEPILQHEQPAGNHNGGQLAFGPDGYLYIGLGDGGGSGDRFDNAQNLGTLLGALLRVDVDGGAPYAVPADNPFVEDPDALGELWAYGLRNPWRFSFDRDTGALYIADVGQSAYEEIDFQAANSGGGENYGWPIMEGTHCYRAEECEQEGFVLPIAEYGHEDGCSVTGGYVYRGATWPALDGVYIFGDYCSGLIWGLFPVGDAVEMTLLLESGIMLSAFGEDEAGELYVVDHDDGGLYFVGMP
jgi:glucose/arabinose dehydrogenase